VGAGGAIEVTGSASAGGAAQVDVTNTVTIAATTSDPAPDNNTDTSTVTAETANLIIGKIGPAHATAGDLIRYSVVVTNEGPLAAEHVIVHDTLPPYLTFAASVPAPAALSATSPAWDLGTLAAGESRTITIDARVAPTTPSGTLVNRVSTESITPERREDDNTASWPTLVETPGTTAVTLAYLRAERTDGGVAVRWQTLLEHNTARFRLVRAASNNLAEGLVVGQIASLGSGGGVYGLLDRDAPAGRLWYWLIEVERDGDELVYGPTATPITTEEVVSLLYLPLVRR
jgi:uncharacterized repeat protein (TIGR01451 family)